MGVVLIRRSSRCRTVRMCLSRHGPALFARGFSAMTALGWKMTMATRCPMLGTMITSACCASRVMLSRRDERTRGNVLLVGSLDRGRGESVRGQALEHCERKLPSVRDAPVCARGFGQCQSAEKEFSATGHQNTICMHRHGDYARMCCESRCDPQNITTSPNRGVTNVCIPCHVPC